MYRPTKYFGRTYILISLFALFIVFGGYAISTGEIMFSSEPAREVDAGTWPSGIAWGDFDNNDWLDLATGVGIDLQQIPDKIYFNYDGHLSDIPGWTSEYCGYSACIQSGDLDNDGDLDLAAF